MSMLRRFIKAPEQAPGEGGLDTLSAEFFHDPYPYYRYLRTRDPVHLTRQSCLLLTRQKDVLRALKNPALGSAPADFASTHPRHREVSTCANVASNLLPFLDGPAYVRSRQFLGPVLRKTFENNPPDAAAPAARLLGPLLEKGTFDALNDFARPLSLQVACEFMGLPMDHSQDLYRWTDNFFRLFSPLPPSGERGTIDLGLTEFRAFFRDILAVRRREPGTDLVSQLALRQIGGEGLNDAELIDNCMLIFADAIENVDAAIASALLVLHQHPREFRRLRKDPGLLPAAVEESLRFEAPGQTAPRIVRDDTAIEGVFARRNTVVLLGLGAANRDPEAFADPDVFRLDRPKAEHLSFGKGNHSCLGFFLVRAEMKAALEALLRATRSIDVPDDDLTWAHRPGHRWLTQLNITISRR
jgi:cytochrome P450